VTRARQQRNLKRETEPNGQICIIIHYPSVHHYCNINTLFYFSTTLFISSRLTRNLLHSQTFLSLDTLFLFPRPTSQLLYHGIRSTYIMDHDLKIIYILLTFYLFSVNKLYAHK